VAGSASLLSGDAVGSAVHGESVESVVSSVGLLSNGAAVENGRPSSWLVSRSGTPPARMPFMSLCNDEGLLILWPGIRPSVNLILLYVGE
jgi:hypothetical protein